MHVRHVLLLLVALDELDLLLDGVDRAAGLADGDDRGLAEVLLREALDGRRHRRGEERGDARAARAVDVHVRLALHDLRGQLVEDEEQVRLEAQVHHPVRLVHDDVPALREHEHVPLDHVLQPARRRDDDLRTLAQVELLLLDRALCRASAPARRHARTRTPPTIDTQR
jgi:hypothetical protein